MTSVAPSSPAVASSPAAHPPLGTALYAAQWSWALDLLRQGAGWSSTDLGATPMKLLIQTLATAPLDVLDDLLDAGLPVHAPNGRPVRPLVSRWFAGAARGPRRMVVLDRLLHHGVSIDLADDLTGTTFLAEVCRHGDEDVQGVQALLARGANVHRSTCLVASEDHLEPAHRHWLLHGWTPLHLAARVNATQVTGLLLARGADPQARTGLPWATSQLTARIVLNQPPTDAERQAGEGWTPLDVAREFDASATMALLEGQALRAALPAPLSPTPRRRL